ncbi:hypothetical protein JNJ66_07195 [Candidatus Saccharibacteria bacterium]|nr:hypothetical protein [Candidatus Saccharibacteria bacterium]
MKYITAIKSALILLAVLLLNSVTVAGHTSAMSTMSHEMGGMSHNSSDTRSCSTLCRTAVVSREENAIRNDENEDDDEPVLPFYVQDMNWLSDSKTLKQELYADVIKPPPKIPIYILYGVFRA